MTRKKFAGVPFDDKNSPRQVIGVSIRHALDLCAVDKYFLVFCFFLYTVSVVVGSLQFQLTTKNEIGSPFRGSLSHFFRWGYFATAPFLFALFYFLRVGNIFFFTCFRLSAPLPQQAAV